MSIEEHAINVWNYFNSIDKRAYGILLPSIPIPYLGNYDSYTSSKLKIITVGLNPSKKEFPKNDFFSRFYGMEKIFFKKTLNVNEIKNYLFSLNIYFAYNRNEWFDNFEPILNEMKSSFHPGQENTALHTDILSPLTTIETWSKYEKQTNPEIVKEITQKGLEIWNQTMEILQPQIVLTSIGDIHRERIFGDQKLEWKRFESFNKTATGNDRKKPYEVNCTLARLPSGRKYLLTVGSSNVIPFMITKAQKMILGRRINRLITRKNDASNELPFEHVPMITKEA